MKSGVFGMIAAEEVARKNDKLDVSKKETPIEPKQNREPFSYSQRKRFSSISGSSVFSKLWEDFFSNFGFLSLYTGNLVG